MAITLEQDDRLLDCATQIERALALVRVMSSGYFDEINPEHIVSNAIMNHDTYRVICSTLLELVCNLDKDFNILVSELEAGYKADVHNESEVNE